MDSKNKKNVNLEHDEYMAVIDALENYHNFVKGRMTKYDKEQLEKAMVKLGAKVY